jgi:hypothetical protein
VCVCLSVCICPGFYLYIVPGIYLYLVLTFVAPLAIDRPQLSARAHITLSIAMVHRNFLGVMALHICLLALIICGTLALGVGLLPALCVAEVMIGVVYRDVFGLDSTYLRNNPELDSPPELGPVGTCTLTQRVTWLIRSVPPRVRMCFCLLSVRTTSHAFLSFARSCLSFPIKIQNFVVAVGNAPVSSTDILSAASHGLEMSAMVQPSPILFPASPALSPTTATAPVPPLAVSGPKLSTDGPSPPSRAFMRM